MLVVRSGCIFQPKSLITILNTTGYQLAKCPTFTSHIPGCSCCRPFCVAEKAAVLWMNHEGPITNYR